jgi:hypothetical protein
VTSAPTVTVGRAVVVLADRFQERLAPSLPEEERDAWKARTDYAWVCSAPECCNKAAVMYKTFDGARRGGSAHANEHHDGRALICADEIPPGSSVSPHPGQVRR